MSVLQPEIGLSPAEVNDKLVSYDELNRVFDLSEKFIRDESKFKGDYLKREFDSFAEVVSGIGGVDEVFATGYPFYAFKEDGGVAHIDEISRFLEENQQKVADDEKRGVGSWICGLCDVTLKLPDFKQVCKTCDLVDLKPRDVFKALPDLDFWVVRDDDVEDTQALEVELEKAVNEAGFYTSDSDMVRSIRETASTLQDIDDRRVPDTHVPIDLHVISRSELMNLFSDVSKAIETGLDLPIAPRSLRKTWGDTDVPYDFVKDFVFSFTEHNWQDGELQESLDKARRVARPKLEDKGVASVVADRAPKEARQLQTPAIRDILIDRVASW